MPEQIPVDPISVRTFIDATLAVVVVVTGYLGKNWFASMKSSVDSLATSVNTLSVTLFNADKTMALHGQRLDQHDDQIGELKTKVCPYPECPLRDRLARQGQLEAELAEVGASQRERQKASR
jgi:hypothetical protein